MAPAGLAGGRGRALAALLPHLAGPAPCIHRRFLLVPVLPKQGTCKALPWRQPQQQGPPCPPCPPWAAEQRSQTADVVTVMGVGIAKQHGLCRGASASARASRGPARLYFAFWRNLPRPPPRPQAGSQAGQAARKDRWAAHSKRIAMAVVRFAAFAATWRCHVLAVPLALPLPCRPHSSPRGWTGRSKSSRSAHRILRRTGVLAGPPHYPSPRACLRPGLHSSGGSGLAFSQETRPARGIHSAHTH